MNPTVPDHHGTPELTTGVGEPIEPLDSSAPPATTLRSVPQAQATPVAIASGVAAGLGLISVLLCFALARGVSWIPTRAQLPMLAMIVLVTGLLTWAAGFWIRQRLVVQVNSAIWWASTEISTAVHDATTTDTKDALGCVDEVRELFEVAIPAYLRDIRRDEAAAQRHEALLGRLDAILQMGRKVMANPPSPDDLLTAEASSGNAVTKTPTGSNPAAQ